MPLTWKSLLSCQKKEKKKKKERVWCCPLDNGHSFLLNWVRGISLNEVYKNDICSCIWVFNKAYSNFVRDIKKVCTSHMLLKEGTHFIYIDLVKRNYSNSIWRNTLSIIQQQTLSSGGDYHTKDSISLINHIFNINNL